MTDVVIKILQVIAVTQNVQGGFIIYFLVANFLQYMSAKNYENGLIYVKVMSKNKAGSF